MSFLLVLGAALVGCYALKSSHREFLPTFLHRRRHIVETQLLFVTLHTCSITKSGQFGGRKESMVGESLMRADPSGPPSPIIGRRKIDAVEAAGEGGITAGESSPKPRSITNTQDVDINAFPTFISSIYASIVSPAPEPGNPENSEALTPKPTETYFITTAKSFGEVLSKSKRFNASRSQLSDFDLDFDRTPTQASFNAEYLLKRKITPFPRPTEDLSTAFTQVSISEPIIVSFQNSAQDSLLAPTKTVFDASQELQIYPLTRPNDTEATIGKLAGIMARVDDAFDVQEWTQSEVRANIDDSPERLTVTPQPVTYTTVGSLKPLLNPHFAPPNRIQREGALRRVPPAPVQTRGHDSHLGVHGTTQQYNKSYVSSTQAQYGPSNQTQYKLLNQPQYESSGKPQYGSTTQSQYGSGSNTQHMIVPSSMTLSDLEKNVLEKLGLPDPSMISDAPSMRSGNIPPAPRSIMPRTDPSLNPKAEAFNILGQVKEDTPGQGSSMGNSLPKIDKMQTLLSISQYPNPMQQSAKDRLSGFAAAKVQNVAKPPVALVTQQPAMFATTSHGRIVAGTNIRSNVNYEEQGKGDFDQNYRFPPPGLSCSSQPNLLATGHSQQRMSDSKLPNEQVFTDQRQQMRSGRPQPLTAGPPGQRQNPSYNSMGANSQQSGQPGGSQLPYHQLPLTLPPNSPWQHGYQMNQFSYSSEHNKIGNTLPLSVVAKYYPNGFPADMTGDYTLLSAAELQKYAGITTEPQMTEAEIRRKQQDKWWYSGVRKFNKTVEEHLGDLETRELDRKNGLAPQRPASPPLMSDDKILSIKDLQEMSEPDVAGPILSAVFGSLLGYADQVITPTNKGMMSRFTSVPAWAIDFNEKGNESFFGEDWGQPPKRHGRDPRFQPFE